jgi:uncharacterized protein
MTRALILAALVGLVAWWVISRLRARDARDDAEHGRRQSRRSGRPGKAKPMPQTMVACAHCGVHLPQADALLDGAGRSFCGDAHRIAGPR